MRVLLTNHLPCHGSSSGAYLLELAQGLIRSGHEVHALLVDGQAVGDEPFPVRRVVSRAGDVAADLPFDFPCFTEHPLSKRTFYDLSDRELADYREQNRRLLDLEVEEFDPQIIHAQHIWIQGHLALETGVPYVLSATVADLAGYCRDARFQSLAQQAAENAGRILVPSDSIRHEVLEAFDVVAERVETVQNAVDDPAHWIEQIIGIYQKVLAERFGDSSRSL